METTPHKHLWNAAAVSHFKRWSKHYDRDIINVLLFRPSHRRVLTQLRHWQRRGLDRIRILDIGCGTGTLAWHCLAMGDFVESITGLDLSEHMLAQGQAKIDRIGMNHKATFTVGDAEHLPFDDRVFDVVTCCNSFHHYPHQDRAIYEMHRVLDKNGRVIIIDGTRDDLVGSFIFDLCVTRIENHVHHCSHQRFRHLLTQAGFTDIKQNVFGICPRAVMNVATVSK